MQYVVVNTFRHDSASFDTYEDALLYAHNQVYNELMTLSRHSVLDEARTKGLTFFHIILETRVHSQLQNRMNIDLNKVGLQNQYTFVTNEILRLMYGHNTNEPFEIFNAGVYCEQQCETTCRQETRPTPPNLIKKTVVSTPQKKTVNNLLDKTKDVVDKIKETFIEKKESLIADIEIEFTEESDEDSDSDFEEEDEFTATKVDEDVVLSDFDDLDEIDPAALAEQIKQLEELKANEARKLKEVKKDHEKEIKKFSRFYDELNDEKRFIRVEKEKEEEKMRIYKCDKNDVYFNVKRKLMEGAISEVPGMFRNKFVIFQFMEENDMFDCADEYEQYCALYNEAYPPENKKQEDDYIPHNVHYLSTDEQQKFKEYLDEDTLIPSFDDVMAALDEDSDEDQGFPEVDCFE